MTTMATTRQWVYTFTDGDPARRDLLGGKGAGLADMAQAGLPVPPGFTITTEACTEYGSRGQQLPAEVWAWAQTALRAIEQARGQRFGNATRPRLLSVRSGANDEHDPRSRPHR